LLDRQISNAATSDSLRISLRTVKGRDCGARNERIVGNGSRFKGRKRRLFLSAIARNRCSARDHAESRA
jgi:hypothetical protein